MVNQRWFTFEWICHFLWLFSGVGQMSIVRIIAILTGSLQIYSFLYFKRFNGKQNKLNSIANDHIYSDLILRRGAYPLGATIREQFGIVHRCNMAIMSTKKSTFFHFIG